MLAGERRLPGTSETLVGQEDLQLVGPETSSPSTPYGFQQEASPCWLGFGPTQMAALLEVTLLVAALWPVCWTRVRQPLQMEESGHKQLLSHPERAGTQGQQGRNCPWAAAYLKVA